MISFPKFPVSSSIRIRSSAHLVSVVFIRPSFFLLFRIVLSIPHPRSFWLDMFQCHCPSSAESATRSIVSAATYCCPLLIFGISVTVIHYGRSVLVVSDQFNYPRTRRYTARLLSQTDGRVATHGRTITPRLWFFLPARSVITDGKSCLLIG